MSRLGMAGHWDATREPPPEPVGGEPCRYEGNEELFFSTNPEDQEQARDMCYQCPILVECLSYSVRNQEPYGVWGGLTERQRRKLLRTMEKKDCEAIYQAVTPSWAAK